MWYSIVYYYSGAQRYNKPVAKGVDPRLSKRSLFYRSNANILNIVRL